MNYCSLQDAWGNSDYISNQFKDYMKPSTNESFGNVEKPDTDKKTIDIETKVDKQKMKFYDTDVDTIELSCDTVFEHLKHCKKCYKRFRNMMKPHLLDNVGNLIQDNKDIIVIILIGISIMLFFNLVNNITK
jgi:alkyl hydroperoxide reductase subunit AhpC